MMDFGFGTFLDKFEQFYGKWATRFLVGLIGASIVAFCLALIWSSIIAPLTDWASNTPQGGTFWWYFRKTIDTAGVILPSLKIRLAPSFHA